MRHDPATAEPSSARPPAMAAAAPGDRRVTVLHVTGTGRSGSTLLGGVLGQVHGFFNVGELGFLWERGLAAHGGCGCGEPVRRCAVWAEILTRALGGTDGPEADVLRRMHAGTTRGRDVQALRIARRLPRPYGPAMDEYGTLLGRVYTAIAEVTGCRVVVDTTKPVTYGHLLDRLTGLDVRMAHLVRDPRAVAWSWLRVKPGAAADAMARRPALVSALLWRAGNAAAAGLWGQDADRYLAVRYEDLIADPEPWLAAIVRLAGPGDPDLPLVDARTAVLAPTHTVAGNVDRHRSGRVVFRLDDEWRRAMPRNQRRVVEAATFPLRLRYGYRGGAGSGE
ncbi:sulfotransferase [Actinomadura soli]|uniref:Sulfotransferase n=1 Tax=Actinomadura soli TaxID=2508997 RepID=A0A5C4J4V2_9ACTN|nr:sulfotransferase [Actinomadura soli]TMQ91782.1 sulfotransferase [Actinomadura soli]